MTTPSPNRSVMIVLAYLWPLALVPLLVEKNDADVQWHAKHGIVLMVAEIVVLAAFGVVDEHHQPRDVRARLRALDVRGLPVDRDPGDSRRRDRARRQRQAPPDSRGQRVREPLLRRWLWLARLNAKPSQPSAMAIAMLARRFADR